MNHTTRNAGAPARRSRWMLGLCMLTLGALSVGVHAFEVRLLRAEAGVVRGTALSVDRRGAPGAALRLDIQTPARLHSLRLRPNPELGAIGGGTAGDAEAFQGEVADRPGSWVAVTRIGDRWSGIWYDGGEYFGIESAGALGVLQGAPRADPDSPMVYRLRDVVWDDLSLEEDIRHAPPGNGQKLATDLNAQALVGGDAGPTHRLAVALVTDWPLAERDGEDLEANLLARLNVIDGIFASQLGVQVTAASVTTHTRRSTDPFSNTGDSSDLLDELASWRAGNAWQRQTALTHLFTGRDLDRRTVGLAYMDTLCSRRYSASLSEARTPAGFAALVAAHEIAHVLGAPHDGDQEGACATTSSGSWLMAPRINGSQQFSSCSVTQMAPRVQAASCLQKLAAPPLPPVVPVEDDDDAPGNGGGGALAARALALLALMALARARRRGLQMRENQSPR